MESVVLPGETGETEREVGLKEPREPDPEGRERWLRCYAEGRGKASKHGLNEGETG